MSNISFKIDDIFSVAGQIVVVTGGGTGLGKAITAGFATNGAKVYITGRRGEVLQATADEINGQVEGGGLVIPIQGDVATKEGVLKIVDAIKDKEEKIDTLVNCAGVMRGWKSPTKKHNDPDSVESMLLDVDDDDFNYSNSSLFPHRPSFRLLWNNTDPLLPLVNLNGVYFMTVSLVPLLRKAESPNVVVIASIAGLANQRTMGSLTYGASKAATIHCASLLAGRLHPMKIRVNTICPGIFPSEMTGVKTDTSHKYNLGDAADKAAVRSTAQRPGAPQEIVGPVLLLASKGGMYMNNALLTVDGGRLMMAGINDGIRMPDETFPEGA
ncbi:hypothetical protein BCR39DRAFT_527959 [Naematelia encephala]|uniref:Rhamnolipids biosynthesis 3-oxoacyl-reductase n=1 Tax=Naematelia encephala TaxID=71784 RepID=A0A1Y2B8F5_9TREE|nr:hypothetical protein BCR39DRAFT_527959 [Naematelia encephala]